MQRLRLPDFAAAALLAAALFATGCATVQAPAPGAPPPAESEVRVPVVLVPGITGTALKDQSSGEPVWGLGRHLVGPRDGGYNLVRPLVDPLTETADDLVAGEVLRRVRLGPATKPVYGPIAERLTQHGFVEGDLHDPKPEQSYFPFAYDWRADNVLTAAKLRRTLDKLADVRGNGYAVDLICQSNGAHICRYLLKYGGMSLTEAEAGRDATPAPRFRIRKIILVGTSNGGSLRILREVHRGRKYLPVIGRTLQPEVIFSFPSIFQDLPTSPARLFVAAEGRPLELDLFDAKTWQRQGWSVFRDGPRRRMAPRPDLFRDEEHRLAYLQNVLDRARRLHRVLAVEVSIGETRFYSIQNAYAPTPHLAVAGLGEDGLLFTGDRELKERPYLSSHISRPGDGHATVASQHALSPQELEAMALPPFLVESGHFELILEPAALRRLVEFLLH